MKQTYNREQLARKAQGVFEEFPGTLEVYATTDGNIFLEKNYAQLHAGEKGNVFTIERPVAKPTQKEEGSRAKAEAKPVAKVASATKAESKEASKAVTKANAKPSNTKATATDPENRGEQPQVPSPKADNASSDGDNQNQPNPNTQE